MYNHDQKQLQQPMNNPQSNSYPQSTSYQQSNPYNAYPQTRLPTAPINFNNVQSNLEATPNDNGGLPLNKKIFSSSLKIPMNKPIVDRPDEAHNDINPTIQKQMKSNLDALKNELMSSFTAMLSDFKNEGKLNTNK